MKVLTLGEMPKNAFTGINNIIFVDTPEEADFVILFDGLKSYFLGTQIGEIIERSYSLEFTHKKPQVTTLVDFINRTKTNKDVSL